HTNASPNDHQYLLAIHTHPLASNPNLALSGIGLQPRAITWESIVRPKPGDWPTYHGQLSGNRYSSLDQIGSANIRQLAPRWIFPIPNARHLEVTPVVADGVMYVTNGNEAW